MFFKDEEKIDADKSKLPGTEVVGLEDMLYTYNQERSRSWRPTTQYRDCRQQNSIIKIKLAERVGLNCSQH